MIPEQHTNKELLCSSSDVTDYNQARFTELSVLFGSGQGTINPESFVPLKQSEWGQLRLSFACSRNIAPTREQITGQSAPRQSVIQNFKPGVVRFSVPHIQPELSDREDEGADEKAGIPTWVWVAGAAAGGLAVVSVVGIGLVLILRR